MISDPAQQKVIPEFANLCGIGYRVQESEGLIVFTQESCIWGSYTRISFSRCEYCWYVETASRWNRVMVSHIVRAYEIVKQYRGDNFSILSRDEIQALACQNGGGI